MRLRGQLRKEVALMARDPAGIAAALLAPPAILWVFSQISLGQVHFGAAFRETSPVALVLCLGIWLSGLTSASSALYRERLAGTLDRLRATPFSPEALLASKALVLGALGVAQAALAWLAARFLVADELGGAHRPETLAGLALLALTAVAAGLLLAALLPSPTQVASCATFLTLAVISLSGFFKPVDQMGWIEPVARSLPFTLAYRSTRTFVDGSAADPTIYALLAVDLVILLVGASAALRLVAKGKPRA